MSVRMELSRILIRELTDFQIIELREMCGAAEADPRAGQTRAADPRSFPIVIGLPEAQAIERRLKSITVKRPQTHDLLAGVIKSLGGQLESITITDLTDHTFYATLDVRKGPDVVKIDSRPSDAIALGIAHDVPIYVEEHVLDAVLNDEA